MKTVCVVMNGEMEIEVVAKDATTALTWLIETNRINEDSWFWDQVHYIQFTDDQLEKMKSYNNNLAYNVLEMFDYVVRIEEVVE